MKRKGETYLDDEETATVYSRDAVDVIEVSRCSCAIQRPRLMSIERADEAVTLVDKVDLKLDTGRNMQNLPEL